MGFPFLAVVHLYLVFRSAFSNNSFLCNFILSTITNSRGHCSCTALPRKYVYYVYVYISLSQQWLKFCILVIKMLATTHSSAAVIVLRPIIPDSSDIKRMYK